MIWGDINKLLESPDMSSLLKRNIRKKTVIKTKDFNAVFISMKKGEEIPPHPENYPVFFFVISGEGVFTTDKGEFSLKEKSCIYYKENTLRGIKSEEDLLLLGIQGPH